MGLNLSAWGDRLNPILVKEVRQATRSRSFTVVLLAALGIASLLSGGILMDAASRGERVSGQALLMSLATTYSWLVRIYVILSAFQSTAEEYTENTIDQLLLSSLSPWRIASGKFQASVVLILLLLSSFLPFAAVTFLMDGVGLQELVIRFGAPTIAGLGLVALAVLAGALARNKGLRILLVSVLVIAVFMGGARDLVMTRMLSSGGMLSPAGRLAILGLTGLQMLGHVILLVGFASAALTPKGEDRSSVPRRAFTVWFALQLLCLAATATIGGVGSLAISGAGIRPLFVQTLPLLALFLSERNTLPRSAKPVPKGKPFRSLRNLWLPGGARAVGYFGLHLAALLIFASAMTKTGIVAANGWLQASACYVLVVVGWVVLPLTLLSAFTQRPRGRIFALGLLVVLWVLAPVARSIAGFLLGQGTDMATDDNMNPFWLLANSRSNPEIWDYRLTIGLATVAVALQLVLLLRRWGKARA